MKKMFVAFMAAGILGSALVATPAQAFSLAKGHSNIISTAASLTGIPYGNGPGQLDCSAYVQKVVKEAYGVTLPRTADGQENNNSLTFTISRSEARPGDLLYIKRGNFAFHAAIYAGGNYMYDSATHGTRTAKRKIWASGNQLEFKRVRIIPNS